VRVARRTAALLLAGTVPLCPAGPAASAGPAEAAPAARAAAALAADPVLPGPGNAGYDVTSYDLDLAYRSGAGTVDADVTIVARATAALGTVELDSAGARIGRVDVDGRPAAFAQRGEKLVLDPVTGVGPGETFRVRVRYTVDPRRAAARSAWVHTDDGFAIAGQPDLAHSVFPCNDVPRDKAAFTVHLDVPEGLTGVANGVLSGTRTAAGRTRSTYVSAHPMATELLQVVVGKYTVVERTGTRGQELRDVVPTAGAAALEPALALTPGQLDWLEGRLGPFPLDTYGLVPVDSDDPPNFDFTGLETQTLTLYRPTYLVQPERNIAPHMMHELVHSWFGNSVTPRTWSDLWINEGHADYYGLLYRYERGWPDSRGFTTMADRMRHAYALGDAWRASSGPVASPTAGNLWDGQRYLGGVLALYALRQEVGERDFDRIERTFLARFRDRGAGTGDYLAVVEQISGVGPAGLLREWLYGTGTPPMPGHPDWTVDPVPAASAPARSPLREAQVPPREPAARRPPEPTATR